MSQSCKSCIITGGARGIGKAFAEVLLKNDSSVVIIDILKNEGEATCKEFSDKFDSNRIKFIHGDVRDDSVIDQAFDEAKKMGDLNVVVNNAAIGGRFVDPKDGITTNVMAAAVISDRARKEMRKDEGGKGGVIINIGSNAGLYHMPGASVYRSSKAALHLFSKSTGLMIQPQEEVRMICLIITFVLTDMTIWFKEQAEAGNAFVKKEIEFSKGWVPIEDITKVFMKVIETDVASGSTIRISGEGTFFIEHAFTEVPFQ